MPHVRSEIIPDISISAIFVKSATKYEIILKENSRKVSVIGLIRKKLQCLNIKLVRNPKKSPINKETTPSITNSARITKGVLQVKETV
jgi:hypothetical protein